ncbi:SGNH/GDSL hydrolase family protein [Colwellia piezophila]|uniref:SGNH/GDSL hydrolase family protein n=1 Tax=Colwellia piezophila TaxID=211668 RepID=UPI0012F8DAE2|nr:SGNH/GDSL hydrolase family protein [Colwellia piezophila]
MPNTLSRTKSTYFAKQLSFYLILIAIPFIILLLLELTLRLSSFGDDYPLFIEKPTNKTQPTLYLQPNPKVINRYFSDETLAPKVSPDTVYFKKEKSEASFRIFIQGGSTAAGFPYGRWGSLQGMLAQRFKRLYPNKEIEIINTAMAAVNSYTLLDFVDEIIEQKPDLVLIYAGHNEYLGIMGVGSAFAAKGGRFATLMHLKFKGWRIYQLLQKLYSFGFSPDTQPSKLNKTLMSQVAKEKEIPLNSDLYQQGITQFTGNMSLILQKYQTAGIPVVLGNLVSNESGQVPFSSVEKVDWQKINRSLSKDNAAPAIARLNSRLSVDKKAENYYQLALNLQLSGRFSEAKQAFVLAKDNDLLRFRAPSEFNVIIESLTKQYGAGLVDVQAMFNENSTQGIVGNKLILEHLHPTIEGYFLLAEAFVDYITEHNVIVSTTAIVPAISLTTSTIPSAETYSRDKARADIPISAVDALYGDFVIHNLVNDFPFTSSMNPGKKDIVLPTSRKFEKQALIKRIEKKSWLTIQKQLLVEYQQRKEVPQAAKIAGAISTAMVDNHKASYIAGQLYQQLKDWPLASYYHNKAFQQQAENVHYILALAQDYFFLKEYAQSLLLLEKADSLVVESSPQKQKILQHKASVQQRLNNTE